MKWKAMGTNVTREIVSLILVVVFCFFIVEVESVLPQANALGTTTLILPNGIAAGDVTQTGAVLWTRSTVPGKVLFEYSRDPAFGEVFTATATVTDTLRPVKVRVSDLLPGTPYFYRVTSGTHAVAVGRFRTAAPTRTYAGVRFGAAGDWWGQLAPYPSIANASARDLEFFVELGDTIAAEVPPPGVETLAEYRLKHNNVYSPHLGLNTWADLRASTSILATIDDNDVRDSFAGGADPSSDPDFDDTGAFINETQLYGNALQAFQEYNPLEDEFSGATGDPRTANKRKLYRFNTYGRDAAVFILDTRSFRDQQLPLSDSTDPVQVLNFLTRSLNDSDRTLLGAQQLADLKADLKRAQAEQITWKFVFTPAPIQNLGIYHAQDRHEGYAAERTELLRFIEQHDIRNVVFVAAGMHGTIVNNLTYQEEPLGAQIPTAAFEVIVGPVAVDPPFGPAVVNLAERFELITPEAKSEYDAMSREQKDAFVQNFVDEKLLAPLGYDPIGLNGSPIRATLRQGDYVAVHTYGWTEFDIGQASQVLTVTTFGIAPYTEQELDNATDIITRTPEIVNQFIVFPNMSIFLPLVLRG